MTPEQIEQEMNLAELKLQELCAQAMGKPIPPRPAAPPPSAPSVPSTKPEGEGLEQARDITKEHHASWLERIRHPFRERRARQEEKEKKIKEAVQNPSHTTEEMERIQPISEAERMLQEAYGKDHGESQGRGFGMGR